MKTKTLILFLLLAIVAKAQEENPELKKLKQAFNIASTELKIAEKSLETSNKLLEESKGYPDLSNPIIKRIESITKERDSLVSVCDQLTFEMKTILNNDKIKLKKQIDLLEKEKTKKVAENSNQNNIAADEKGVKKTINKYKKDYDKIVDNMNDLKSYVESKNSINVLSKNTNGEMARYMLMSGFNFELNSIDKLKYVGHFNIYVPVTEKTKWGVNTGLLKVNYKNNEADNSYLKKDYVKVNPLDDINIGSSYYGQYNKYSSKTDITSYSAYFQVLYKLLKKNNTAISAQFHTELLSTTYKTTSTIANIQQDEYKITNQQELDNYNQSGINLLDYIEKEKIRNDNLLMGYFGLGTTLDLGLLDNCTLFFQATGGVTIQHNTNDRDVSLSRNGSLLIADMNSKPKSFYLIRCYFEYYTSKSSQLVVGTDIRGFFPNQSPYYTIYAGVNLGIDKIADLFKDKK